MNKKSSSRAPLSYTTRSGWAVFFWSLFTFGLYGLYWGYRHWKEIGEAEQRKTYPIWASIFMVFTMYPLLANFRRLYPKAFPAWYPGAAAVFFIAASIASEVPTYIDTTMIGLAVSFVLFIFVAGILGDIQTRLNHARTAKKKRPFSAPERVIIVIGAILFLGLVVLYSVPNFGVPELTPEQQARAAYLNGRAESLDAEYNACVADADRQAGELPDDASETAWNESVKKYESCESIRVQQNQAVDELNKLNMGIYSIFAE